MQAVFAGVGGFSFNSFAERRLVERTFRVAHLPAAVTGNAVVEGAGDPRRARDALGVDPGEPFVLCVGRVERSKGSHLLAELWGVYHSRRRSAPKLVFLGPVHEPLDVTADGGVVVAGAQPEDVKWGALDACTAVVSPSAWESFSLVMLEGWMAGKPVLVNGRCEPTVEHCRRSAGGLWFEQYADFEVAVDRLLKDRELRATLAANGRAYAIRHFSWPAITARYAELADRIMGTFPARAAR
jgi:glycosyltransferase involved in cell wall biosynthesis